MQNNTLGQITFNPQTLHKSIQLSPKFNTKELLVKINIVITTFKTWLKHNLLPNYHHNYYDNMKYIIHNYRFCITYETDVCS